VGVEVFVGVRVGVRVFVGVFVGVRVFVGVGVGVDEVLVTVGVTVGVTVFVGVFVGVWVGVGLGEGGILQLPQPINIFVTLETIAFEEIFSSSLTYVTHKLVPLIITEAVTPVVKGTPLNIKLSVT
jgi:hypothetical protein